MQQNHHPESLSPPCPTRRLVIADDDEDFREYLADVLRAQGYEVVEAKNGAELLERLEFDSSGDALGRVFHAVVTDVRMPGVTGTSVLEGLSSVGAANRVVIMSAFPDRATVQRALRLGASAVLAKPFRIEALLAALERVAPMGAEPLQAA
jgi:CheY-like chemotaxis protein